MPAKPRLLSIVEMGGYPDPSPLYREAGFEVLEASNQRKALKLFAAQHPDVIVAEFIYTPDFRDRVCNLDTLCSQIKVAKPETRLIVLYEPEDAASLARFQENFRPFAAIAHPVNRAALLEAVRAARKSLWEEP
jgi:DNA-binding NarL/FixJ family response regulator